MNPLRGRRRPASPEARAIIQASGGALSRRALLGTAGAVGAGVALGACAPPKPPATGGLAALDLPKDVSATDKVVKWANWTAYMDIDEETQKHPTLEAFTKRTGIKVEYFEDIDDNDTYFSKITPQLRAGQSIDRDIFTPTDWMAGRVIREQLCQPLDLMSLPHVVSNMLDPLRQVSFDPGRRQSVTWQSGFAGIGYNRKKVGRELKSLDDLWTDDLKGKVVVLSEFRDTIGIVMQSQGVDIESDWGRTEFENAVEFVEQKIDEGYIRRVKGNAYLEDLAAGTAYAGITWSGDIFTLAWDTGDDAWTFTIPESGGTLWSDNMMVPITSNRQANAHKVIDYYYEPAVAAEVAAFVNYVCPVKGAQEEMMKIDPELAESPFIFPSEQFIADSNIQGFRALSADDDSAFAKLWSDRVILGG
ncbi:MAG: extracellular solute-binding protein [Nocardioides sp.]|uniref:extracellular solute-binding protein n=1 Tax=Nocardioides sp. TaxID=35761 RepID=UPI003F0E5751